MMISAGDQNASNTNRISENNASQISVIVCTYNRANLLGEALRSLEEQTLPASQYEVLVINNNSTDNTQKLAEEFSKRNKNYRVIIEPKQGLSNARNKGFRKARGEYVAYMDDDAKATPEWCERILSDFETVTPKPMALGGKILPWYEVKPPEWFSDELETRTWGEQARFLRETENNIGFSGSNMAFQKTILEKYGGFSPSYGMKGAEIGLGEETELFSRIQSDDKLFWYNPYVLVNHLVPKDHMSAQHYIHRGYIGGRTSQIDKRNRLNIFGIIGSVCRICFQLIVTPYEISTSSQSAKAVIVKKSRKVGFIFGQLAGCFPRRKG